jgi:hypothetical protein
MRASRAWPLGAATNAKPEVTIHVELSSSPSLEPHGSATLARKLFEPAARQGSRLTRVARATQRDLLELTADAIRAARPFPPSRKARNRWDLIGVTPTPYPSRMETDHTNASDEPLACAGCGASADLSLDERFCFDPLCDRCLRLRSEGLCVDCGNRWVAQTITDDGDIAVDPEAGLRCSPCGDFYRNLGS